MVDAKIVDDDKASNEDVKISPTPNSVAKTKRPIGRRQAEDKGKKVDDIDIEKSLQAIANVRKEIAEERKVPRSKEMEENRANEESRTAMEERKTAAQKMLASTKERKVAMEEIKAAIDEMVRMMEQEKKYFLHGHKQP
jgi:septal ring factor EnvC (AmiA/AmiB activator)